LLEPFRKPLFEQRHHQEWERKGMYVTCQYSFLLMLLTYHHLTSLFLPLSLCLNLDLPPSPLQSRGMDKALNLVIISFIFLGESIILGIFSPHVV